MLIIVGIDRHDVQRLSMLRLNRWKCQWKVSHRPNGLEMCVDNLYDKSNTIVIIGQKLNNFHKEKIID